MTQNVAASVHQRLLNRAHNEHRPFGELLQYFALERFLYRLGQSLYEDSIAAAPRFAWLPRANIPARFPKKQSVVGHAPQAISHGEFDRRWDVAQNFSVG